MLRKGMITISRKYFVDLNVFFMKYSPVERITC